MDVVYLVVGKMTGLLAEVCAGERVEVWGPLGNGFPDLDGRKHVGLVAGGIGQTPFLAHVRELLGARGYGGRPARRMAERVYSLLRSAHRRPGGRRRGLSRRRGGSASGQRRRQPRLPRLRHAIAGTALRHWINLVGCGPEPMLHALAGLAAQRGTPCHVSLETPMACGVGVCFSCVTRVKTADGWDYRRVCVDGPVFDAAGLAWDVDAS